MANEELIYRITRAVYARLGAGADERTVEALVMDVYRAVEPALGDGVGAKGEGARASEGRGEGRARAGVARRGARRPPRRLRLRR
jgi:hypothetical protein